jgi:hypothetical protein
MIAAIYCRKSTTQAGPDDKSESVERQLRPRLRCSQELDRRRRARVRRRRDLLRRVRRPPARPGALAERAQAAAAVPAPRRVGVQREPTRGTQSRI